MSDGIRSGVNWMRLKLRLSESARVRIMSVLARPGTPTSRQWPRAKMAMSSSSRTLLLADDDLAHLLADAAIAVVEALDGGQVALDARPVRQIGRGQEIIGPERDRFIRGNPVAAAAQALAARGDLHR